MCTKVQGTGIQIKNVILKHFLRLDLEPVQPIFPPSITDNEEIMQPSQTIFLFDARRRRALKLVRSSDHSARRSRCSTVVPTSRYRTRMCCAVPRYTVIF